MYRLNIRILQNPLLWMCVSLLLILFTFRETGVSLIQKWQHSGTYAHGFLVIPIVFYLIWDKKDQLKNSPIKPTLWAMFPIIFFSFTWYIGEQNHILILQQLSLVNILISIVLGYCGFSIFKKLLFPLGYLYFAIPFGNFLIAELQDITAFFTVKGLELSGVTVYAEGWQITTTRGHFAVAEACSGIRYLIASIALGVLYAHFAFRTLSKKLIFVAICIMVPIVANGIRAYSIVMLAHFTHMKIAVGVDHLIYGWLFFGCMMLLLFWVGNTLRKNEPRMSHNQHTVQSPHAISMSTNAYKAIVLSLTLAAALYVVEWIFANQQVQFKDNQFLDELAVHQWQLAPSIDNEWQPNFLGAKAAQKQYFNEQYKSVDLYLASYTFESEGHELISSQNSLFDNKIWNKARQGTRRINFLGNHFQCQELELFNRFGRRLIWSWYRINGVNTQNPIHAKLLILYHRLIRDLEEPMIIAISTEFQYYPKQARDHMTEFLAHLKEHNEKTT